MSICYGLIIKKLQRTLMQHKANPKASNCVQARNKTRHRITILCVTLVLSFIVCRLLYHFLEIGKLKTSLGLSVSDFE